MVAVDPPLGGPQKVKTAGRGHRGRAHRKETIMNAPAPAGSVVFAALNVDGADPAALAYMSLDAGLLGESARLGQHAEAVAAERGHLLARMFLCDTLGHRRLREG
jgi:hypothetical protein